jgi:type III secretion protein U
MSEKKHEATQSHLQKVRRRGQWFLSKEMTGAAVMAAGAVLWSGASGPLGTRLVELATVTWQPSRLAAPDLDHALGVTIQQTAETTAVIVGVLMLGFFVVALVTAFLQVGPMFSVNNLLRFERLNPGAGFKRIFFSGTTYKKTAINLAKAAIMIGLMALVVRSSLVNLSLSVRQGPVAVYRFFNGTFTAFLWQASALMILFGMADFMIERKQFLDEQKMDDEQVKEDMRQHQMSPEVKSKIFEAARE